LHIDGWLVSRVAAEEPPGILLSASGLQSNPKRRCHDSQSPSDSSHIDSLSPNVMEAVTYWTPVNEVCA
jgi:hypothetical protein